MATATRGSLLAVAGDRVVVISHPQRVGVDLAADGPISVRDSLENLSFGIVIRPIRESAHLRLNERGAHRDFEHAGPEGGPICDRLWRPDFP